MKRAARFKTGSIVFDKRRRTWNFLWWENGKRRSRLIGSIQQYRTKGAAQRAAQPFQPSEAKPIPNEAETVKALAARYEAERFQIGRAHV